MTAIIHDECLVAFKWKERLARGTMSVGTQLSTHMD